MKIIYMDVTIQHLTLLNVDILEIITNGVVKDLNNASYLLLTEL